MFGRERHSGLDPESSMLRALNSFQGQHDSTDSVTLDSGPVTPNRAPVTLNLFQGLNSYRKATAAAVLGVITAAGGGVERRH